MKILRIIHSARPHIGGPIEGIKQSSPLMIEAGHELTHVTLDDPKYASEIDLPGASIHLGPCHTSYGYAPRLNAWLKDNMAQFDCVLVHGLWQHHGFAVWKQARQLGLKAPSYYVLCHGMLDPWFKTTYPLKHLKKWLYWPWGEYRVLRDARFVLFTAEEERRLARKSFWLYRANEAVIGYGTKKPYLEPEVMRKEWQEIAPFDIQRPYFLFLGRLHPKKGADLLIQAYLELKREGLELPDLVLAGPEQDPGYAQLLRQVASNDPHIHFVGMLQGAPKWGALTYAVAMSLPSHQENFGIVVAESLAVGTPVLISDKVNIWREVKNGEAGMIAEDNLPGTKQMLAEYIGLTNKQRSTMRERAKQCYDANFSIEHSVKTMLTVMESGLNSSR